MNVYTERLVPLPAQASAGSMGGNYSYEDAMAAGAVNGDGTVDQVFAAAHPMLAAQIKAGSLQGPASKAPPGSAGSLQGPSSMGSAAPASAVGSLPPSAVGMSAAAAGAAMPSAANVSSWATFGAGAAGVGPSAPGNAGVSPTAGMNPAAMASYAKMMAASGNPAAAAGSAPSMASMAAGGGDASWMLYEMAQIKERLTAMERKSEALWHVRVRDSLLCRSCAVRATRPLHARPAALQLATVGSAMQHRHEMRVPLRLRQHPS